MVSRHRLTGRATASGDGGRGLREERDTTLEGRNSGTCDANGARNSMLQAAKCGAWLSLSSALLSATRCLPFSINAVLATHDRVALRKAVKLASISDGVGSAALHRCIRTLMQNTRQFARCT